MLTIGEFSRLTQVPSKTLRYYDEIGLFKPKQVDRFTQYRYYSVEQLPRLYRVLALRGLGLSLEQIAQLLDEDLSTEQIRGMLRMKQAELQYHIETEQSRLAYVEAKLRQIEEDGQMSEYEVILKDVEPVRVASMCDTAATRSHIGSTLDRLFDTLIGHLNTHRSQFPGSPITLYLDMEYGETDMLLEAAMPVEDHVPETEQIQIKTLPAQTMASVVHHGPFTALDRPYEAMLRWIESNGYKIVGPNRELNLQYERGDPDKYVTELQVPVARRED